jgi:hypothetical protein
MVQNTRTENACVIFRRSLLGVTLGEKMSNKEHVSTLGKGISKGIKVTLKLHENRLHDIRLSQKAYFCNSEVEREV